MPDATAKEPASASADIVSTLTRPGLAARPQTNHCQCLGRITHGFVSVDSVPVDGVIIVARRSAVLGSWHVPLGTGFYNAAMRVARGHTIGIVLIAALILIYLVVRYFHVAPWGAR